MCARYPLSANSELIAKHFGLDEMPLFDPVNMLRPNDEAPIVVEKKDYLRTARTMRWGMIPWWAKNMKIGSKMINADANTLFEDDVYKKYIYRHRCLIPAEGFFEIKTAKRTEENYLVRVKGNGLMGFAGIWARWHHPDDEENIIDSFSVIITNAEELTGNAHDTMPVIIRPDDYNAWLDPSLHDITEILSIMNSYPLDKLEWQPYKLAA